VVYYQHNETRSPPHKSPRFGKEQSPHGLLFADCGLGLSSYRCVMPVAKNGKKTCSKCGEEFPGSVDYFYRDRERLDGLSHRCKKCDSARCALWRTKYPEKHCAIQRRWRKKNPKKAHAVVVRARRKSWALHPWRLHRHRLRISISRRVSRALVTGKAGQSWEKLVGYSLDELRAHLQSLFKPQMTWQNYGQWVVDHVRPIASFSFTGLDDPGFKECWALHNLQPLWARENLRKSATWDGQGVLPFASIDFGREL